MIRPRHIAFIPLCLLLWACHAPPPPHVSLSPATPSYWVTYHAFDRFTFQGPPDLVDLKPHGIDSLVGEYQSSALRVSFDYGWYSGNQGGAKQEDVVIDGRKATLVTLEKGAFLYVPDVGPGRGILAGSKTKLSMNVSCNDPADVPLCTALLRSIKFNN